MRNPACLSNFCLHIVSLTQVQSLHPAVGTLSQLCASLLVYAAVAFIYYRVLKWITVLLGGFHPIFAMLLHPWTPIRFPADWSMCYIASDSPNSSTGSSINAPCLSPLYRWSLLRKEVLKSRWWAWSNLSAWGTCSPCPSLCFCLNVIGFTQDESVHFWPFCHQ